MKDKEVLLPKPTTPLLDGKSADPARKITAGTSRSIISHRRSSSDKSAALNSSDPIAFGVDVGSFRKKNTAGSSILRGFYHHNHHHNAGQDSAETSKACETDALTLSNNNQTQGNKSLLSSFARPLLSSTPIAAQGIFHHKRRSSTGVEQVSGSRKTSGEVDRRFPRWSVTAHNLDTPGSSTENQGGIFHRFRTASKHSKHDQSGSKTVATEDKDEDDRPARPESPQSIKQQLQTVTEDNLDNIPEAWPEKLLHPRADSSDDGGLQSMERSLLTLLEEFQSGKLRAFSGEGTMEKMRQVREQQERLAKLHFELYEEQAKLGMRSEEAKGLTQRNLKLLTEGLDELNDSVQRLGWDEGINLNRKI